MTPAARASAIRKYVEEMEEHARELKKAGYRTVLNHVSLHHELNPYGCGIITVKIEKHTYTMETL